MTRIIPRFDLLLFTDERTLQRAILSRSILDNSSATFGVVEFLRVRKVENSQLTLTFYECLAFGNF